MKNSPVQMKKSEVTRTRILVAANTVLRKNGYSGTRLADIAKAAGTHAGAMYYHFESKDALVEELLERNAASGWEFVERQISSLPPTATYRERVIVATRAILSNLLGEKGGDASIHIQLLNQIPAEMRSRLFNQATATRHFIRDMIRDGQKAGEFRTDINPSVVALMLLSNLIWAHDWFYPTARISIDVLAHDMCHILLAGIEQREAPHAKTARATKKTIGKKPAQR